MRKENQGRVIRTYSELIPPLITGLLAALAIYLGANHITEKNPEKEKQKSHAGLISTSHNHNANLDSIVAETSTTNLPAEYLGPNADYSFLMSDSEFTNSNYLTAEEIQNHLENNFSALANSIQSNYFSNIVCRVAGKYQINPLLLISRAQTEHGAVKKSQLSEKEIEKLMGADVTDNGRRSDGAFGFTNQMEACARKLRRFYDSWTNGTTIKVDYETAEITPTNAATFSLLKYTPHRTDIRLGRKGGGNHLFMQVYSGMRAEFEEGKRR